MLNQQKMEEICTKLKGIYHLKEVRVETVKPGLRDAIVVAGEEKFGIVEKDNGIAIVVFGQPLQEVILTKHGIWRGVSMDGQIFETDYRAGLRC